MTTLPPSLKALRAFEATARHLSMTKAADELAVTQPAVSQQIKALEAYAGQTLLYREGQGLALTSSGKAYAERLHGAFTEIKEATDALVHRKERTGILTVSLLPTLAQRWLIPRLGTFQASHPHIEVRFSTTARVVDLRREDVDLAIRFGEGPWPGCDSQFMMANDMFPVLSPQLQTSHPITKPVDLAEHIWLWVDAEPRPGDWPAWLEAAGVEGLEPRGQIAFETSSQALAAATAGLGVAIGHRPFVMDDLSSNRLVMPLEATLPSEQAFHILTSSETKISPQIEAFKNWLLAEAHYNPA
jgi:LysR family glycine cleavage system transcriptional activator